jgi:hypothetical protein
MTPKINFIIYKNGKDKGFVWDNFDYNAREEIIK